MEIGRFTAASYQAATIHELMSTTNNTTIPEVRDAGIVLRDFQADERMRQEAWYREKQMRDEASQIDDAIEEGIAIGIEKGITKGIEEGIEKGIEKGTLQTLVRLVDRGRLTLSEAAEEAGVSVSEFEDWMKANVK